MTQSTDMDTVLPTREAESMAPLVKHMYAVSSPPILLMDPLANSLNALTLRNPPERKDTQMTQTQLWNPGDAEANAAIAALTDTNPGTTRLIEGRLHTVWAKDDIVLFRCPDGETRKGIIVEVLVENGDDSEYHIAAHVPGHGRQHYAVKNGDVQVF